MIWADRLGVCLLLLWLLWGVLSTPKGHEEQGMMFLIVFVAAPWLFCRMVDFLATGSVRITKSGLIKPGPWRHDQRVNLRVGLVVVALAAIVYWSPADGATRAVATLPLIVFGYWLISSAGRSSAANRGEIIEPGKAGNLVRDKGPRP